jgi:hypothetical protein
VVTLILMVLGIKQLLVVMMFVLLVLVQVALPVATLILIFLMAQLRYMARVLLMVPVLLT